MSDMLLTIQDVTKRLNCATSTVYRWMKLEKFPRPMNFGGMVRWTEGDLIRFISEADQRRGDHDPHPSGPRPSGTRRGRPVGSFNKKK